MLDNSSQGKRVARRIIAFLMALIAFLAFTRGFPLIRGVNWHIETVQTGAHMEEGTSITVDICDKVHISYPTWSGVKWAKRVGTTWHIETVDSTPDAGWGTSIAVDGSGAPHISYTTSVSEVKYARWLGPSLWSIQTLATETYLGLAYSSIALDSSDNPHIIYCNRWKDALNYTYWTGTTWVNETIDSGGSPSSSLVLDSNDHPRVGFSSAEGLKFAYWNGSAWTAEIVDDSVTPTRLSLALDFYDNPRIAYYDDDSDVLKHARRGGPNSWVLYTLVNTPGVGNYPSLDIDSANNSHISFFDGPNGALEYIVGKRAVWTRETVESGGLGTFTSLVLDSEDNPHISYWNYIDNEAKYAGIADKVYDFVVLGAGLSKPVVGQGYNVTVSATLLNQGTGTETFNVTLYANKTEAMSQSFSVEPGEPIAVNLVWPTGSVRKGVLNIEVFVASHPCEPSVEDNLFSAGWLMVSIPGDMDGDKDVDIFDIVPIASAYGSSQGKPEYDPVCDIDGDGDVDIFDVVIAAGNYGASWIPQPAPRRIYVVNAGDNSVSVIDNTKVSDGIAGNEVIDVIDLAFDGRSVMVDVDGSRNLVYVTSMMVYGGDHDKVSIIDEPTVSDGIPGNEVIDTLTINLDIYPPGGAGFFGVHVCEYHQVIWVTAANLFGVLAYDGYSYDVMPEGEIRLSLPPDPDALPLGVDVDEARNRVYVASTVTDKVYVIDEYRLVDSIPNNEVVDSIDVGHGPFGIAVDDARNRIYVANQLDDTVTVIDGTKVDDGIPANEVMVTIAVGNKPSHIALDEARNMVYVTNQLDGTVSVIDGSKVNDKIGGNEVVDTITVGNVPLGIAVDEMNNRIYVANNDDNTVSVIDGYLVDDGTPANEVVATIDVGTNPSGVAVSTFLPP
ncbi:MAG: YncE family protein [Candidatus Bathyarchaeota archaeon]|nr:MAG: YncE family protein [Candidatus Bathyarchaeota archaeon]